TGALKWATNAGAIVNRPILAFGKLYVATYNGTIKAYDPAGDPQNVGQAKPLWSTFIQLPLPIQRSPWVEFRSGPLQGTLLAVDLGGNLRAIHDNGTTGTILWATAASGILGTTVCPLGTLCYRGVPVVSPSIGKIYLGRSDGRIQQIGSTGLREGVIDVNPSPSNSVDVFDPSLDLESGAPDINRLVVVAGGTAGGNGMVTRLSVPICENTPVPEVIGCGCGSGGVCGTGEPEDPFRCCNLAQDTCANSTGSNPCTPLRCSIEPDCCLTDSCSDPVVLANCGAATHTCQRFGGSLFKVPDGTVCDDLQACTSAVPIPTPVACTFRPSDGGNCTQDSDCTAPGAGSCSGTGAAIPAQGGSIVGGKCCPVGTACNLFTD
ncbi:MAG: PQQ-binding-like beta-propeller repeat protein, partial [Acidobacteria bacterium]|nr:PQQ-binding-like beta-propeller repeat protein [Acidobacteriota bacterium]